MNAELSKWGLGGVGTYLAFQFGRYQASRDQAQKVSRAMEDALAGICGLINQKGTAQALKPELNNILKPLTEEMRRLDDMVARLPIKRLQRKQRHVLRHTEWLLNYLARPRNKESGFFLFVLDVATGCDREVENILTSLYTGRAGRCPCAGRAARPVRGFIIGYVLLPCWQGSAHWSNKR
ncbi:hypothetical protein SMY66_004004 [Cronobacter sakazakii]|nr:hypothetical protein [Cronobacter sakazakii]ELY4230391.1 hypothetical protein [Cronobacter sakazakii]